MSVGSGPNMPREPWQGLPGGQAGWGSPSPTWGYGPPGGGRPVGPGGPQPPKSRVVVILVALVDLVFQRTSASAPWMIVFSTQYSWNGSPILPPTTSASFSTPEPETGFVASPQQLPADMAAYWQSWIETGGPPASTPFHTGGYLATHGTGNAQFNSALRDYGDVQTIQYTSGAATDGSYGFAGSMGSAIQCSTVRWSAKISAVSPGATVTQPSDRSMFAPQIPPGSYSWITQQGLRESCFVVLPGVPYADVLGEWGGFFAAQTSSG